MKRAEREWQNALASPLRGDDFSPMSWGKIVMGGCTAVVLLLPIAIVVWGGNDRTGFSFAKKSPGW